MDCIFVEQPDGTWQCDNCGFVVKRQLRKNCRPRVSTDSATAPGPPSNSATSDRGLPSRPRRLLNFTVAAVSHFLQGMPTCTDQQMAERIAICRQCPLFLRRSIDSDMGVCSHEKCGCPLTEERKFISKIGWASQHCPVGKW